MNHCKCESCELTSMSSIYGIMLLLPLVALNFSYWHSVDSLKWKSIEIEIVH